MSANGPGASVGHRRRTLAGAPDRYGNVGIEIVFTNYCAQQAAAYGAPAEGDTTVLSDSTYIAWRLARFAAAD